MESNEEKLSKTAKKHNFLLDTSSILYFEAIYASCKVSIITALVNQEECNFYILDDVLRELISGKNAWPPSTISLLRDHILHSESVFSPGWKENRFLIQENGQTKYLVLNKISVADYSQIWLCQNHPNLMLVSNDQRIIKSGINFLKDRMLGTVSFLNFLTENYANNSHFSLIKEAGDTLFEKKHAIGGRVIK